MDINKFLSKLFGNKSTRDMKLIQPWVEKIKAAYPAIQALDNDALRAKTKNCSTPFNTLPTTSRRRLKS